MKSLSTRLLLPLLFVVGLSTSFWGCTTTATVDPAIQDHIDKQKGIDDTLILGYLNRRHITSYTRTSSGLYLINTLDGSGPFIKTGQLFSVKYVGYYLGYANDGRIFDNSNDNHTTCRCVTFVAGEQIAGWNEAVLMMQAGTKKTLLIPSYLAYGLRGNATISPDQPLRFDMEILQVGQ